MPLIMQPHSDLRPTGNTVTQKQRSRNQNDPPGRSLTPLSKSHESQTRIQSAMSLEPASVGAMNTVSAASQPNPRSARAAALKLPVPNTISSAIEAQRWRQMGDNTDPRALEDGPRTVFDDTESLPFDDSTLRDGENKTVVFRGNSTQPSKPTHERSAIKPGSQDDSDNGAGVQEPYDRMHERQQQHSSRHFLPQYAHVSSSKDFDIAQTGPDHSDDDGQSADEYDQALETTPSRISSVPPTNGARSCTTSKTVSFDSPNVNCRQYAREDSPELPMPGANFANKKTPRSRAFEPAEQTKQYTASNRDPESMPSAVSKAVSRWSAPRKPGDGNPAAQFNDTATSKPQRASGYPLSSDDEPLAVSTRLAVSDSAVSENESSRKRPHEEVLDYEVAELKCMKYDDLVQQDFEENPRNPSSGPTFDSSGKEVVLSQRLNNLQRMDEADQKTLFRSQNDEDWAQTGAWFIEKFQEDLKKLINIRTERRKISLRYEHEVRQRQKSVEWAFTGVEEELRELKKGGGELIKGRDPPSGRGTPQEW